VRNLYRHTKICSGQEPQLIEGDVFTTIVQLTPSTQPDGTVDGTVETSHTLLAAESAVLRALQLNGSLTVKSLVTATGVSERQVKRILVNLRAYGLIRREGSDRYGKWVVPRWSSARRQSFPDHA